MEGMLHGCQGAGRACSSWGERTSAKRLCHLSQLSRPPSMCLLSWTVCVTPLSSTSAPHSLLTKGLQLWKQHQTCLT